MQKKKKAKNNVFNKIVVSEFIKPTQSTMINTDTHTNPALAHVASKQNERTKK